MISDLASLSLGPIMLWVSYSIATDGPGGECNDGHAAVIALGFMGVGILLILDGLFDLVLP